MKIIDFLFPNDFNSECNTATHCLHPTRCSVLQEFNSECNTATHCLKHTAQAMSTAKILEFKTHCLGNDLPRHYNTLHLVGHFFAVLQMTYIQINECNPATHCTHCTATHCISYVTFCVMPRRKNCELFSRILNITQKVT